MNTRQPIESSEPPEALSVSFNADSSCFAVALNTGFLIFSSDECDQQLSREFGGGLGLAQMMGKTNWLALVGGGRRPLLPPNKVMLWDEAKEDVAVEISNMSNVWGVRLARNRIVAVLQDCVRVYSFARPPNLLARHDTTDNPLGLCDMSERHIAFPGRTAGQVQLVEIATSNISIIPAHSASLVAIRFSLDGSLLATASEKGTIIRVWATNTGARVAELRRGWDPATIFSLGFSPSGAMLACTSDKGTLHVYDVPHPSKSNQPAAASTATAAAGGGGGGSGSGTSPRGSKSPTSRFVNLGASTASLISGVGVEAGGSSSTVGLGDGAQDGGDGGASKKGKWGLLGKIPLMPRYFSDATSFAQANFSHTNEPTAAPAAPPIMIGSSSASSSGMIMMETSPAPPSPSAFSSLKGTPYDLARPPVKGIIGWIKEDTIVVIGAGTNARYERFKIVRGQDGGRMCVRDGWKQILGQR
ncbi:hypothetical protein MAPG_01972 [Magnaporthiopsis poae ATCC 64411]|uniref:Uncharacterized protein n=1 Tax=Magnaporthiopsis poae (strain ATCC 64411 / 73-15) TaxID=644358 RepID=A0A0C4DQ35_MAGP6|nr:hypothetical protein MAPG_01972 [Magnaporthiopsis poae ATCC 64411]